MDTGRTTKLRNADNGRFHVFARNHHKVSQLVDDNYKIRHVLGRIFHVGIFATVNVSVIRLNFTHLIVLKHLEATLHLSDAPLKRTCSLAGLGYHRNIQVRKAGVTGKLNALWVHHNKAHLFRCGTHQHRHYDGIQKHRLTRARRTRHQ